MRRNFPDDPGSHPEGTRAAASNLQKIRKWSHATLVLKPEDWPSSHRALWEAGTAPKGGRLARPKHADRLRPLSIRNARRGYGAFLAVLRDAGFDIATPRPTNLATPENVARFVDALFARGNVPNSIGQRLFNLRTAFRIMEPLVPLDWITRPGGISINELYPQEFGHEESLDPRTLTALGLELLRRARTAPILDDTAKRRARNGLFCALLAAFPARIGSLAVMRFGQSVIDEGDRVLLRFASKDVKNGRRLECDLPRHLLPHFRYYVDKVLPSMGGSLSGSAFWRNVDGSPFEYAGIIQMFRRLTARELGRASGTHAARKGLPTVLAEIAPDRLGLAAAVLGSSEEIVQRHYNRATMLAASREANAALEEEREELRLRARSLLARRHGKLEDGALK